MTLKKHGTLKFGRLIQQNIDQAHYLARLVDASPELELALPASLNVVCFRYTRPDLNDGTPDDLNKQAEIETPEAKDRRALCRQHQGQKVPAWRIINHRSRRGDFDVLVQEVIRIGNEPKCETE